MPESKLPSTKPYMIRAIHQWCEDNGFTPYLAVLVGHGVEVPMQHVSNGEIVLNVSFAATSGLVIGNEQIDFKARFGGVPQHVSVPVDKVLAIYSRENGQGMVFPVDRNQDDSLNVPSSVNSSQVTLPPARPALTRIK